jgi:hypothetical protein
MELKIITSALAPSLLLRMNEACFPLLPRCPSSPAMVAHDGKPKFGWCGYPRLVLLSSKMSVRVPNMGADTSSFSHYSNKSVRIPK